MTETIFCVMVFMLVFVIFLKFNQTRQIRNEQNQLIGSLKEQARLMRKELLEEHMQDIKLLNWADRAGHYDARCESLREELRMAMEEDDA